MGSTALGRVVFAVLALFLGLWLATARWIGPSGDSAAVWGSVEPLRTVLCVAEGPSLLLAAAPGEAERAAVDAHLSTAEIVQGSPFLGAVHRDHAYRARLSVGGLQPPWMKNEYTAGFTEWLPRGLFRATGHAGAGRLANLLLGALVLLGTMLCASRIGRWPAAAIAGAVLAADPGFHLWKKVLSGPEVWLQVCAVAAAWFVIRAVQERAPLRLMPAALIVGVGVHVKPTFAAVALPLALLSLPVLPWSALSRRGWIKVAAAALVLALLGSAPSLAYWASRPGRSYGQQESAAGRAGAAMRRWTGPRKAQESGRASDAPTKRVGLGRALLVPGSYHADYWAIRARRDNDPRTSDSPPRDRPPPLVRVGAGAAALLAGLAVFAAIRRRGLCAWAVVLGSATLLCVRLLHPDPHHLGVALPFLALGLGVGAAAVGKSRIAWSVVALLALVVVLGRGTDLARLDGAMEERAGRLLDRRAWAELAQALEEEGALSPAGLDYELMGQAEVYTGGRVRPFLYARSSRRAGPECHRNGTDPWLSTILRAHAGGHLLVAWGTEGNPTSGGLGSWVDPARVARLASAQGQEIRPLREVHDSRGRWAATLYGIGPAR